MPRCPKYPRPKNGALVCLNFGDGSQAICRVACENGTDFVRNPAMIYVCDDSGQWQPFSPFSIGYPQLPWPDCKGMFFCPGEGGGRGDGLLYNIDGDVHRKLSENPLN